MSLYSARRDGHSDSAGVARDARILPVETGLSNLQRLCYVAVQNDQAMDFPDARILSVDLQAVWIEKRSGGSSGAWEDCRKRAHMIGKIIGNYQITGELAQGGMGAVYRGRHLHLPREVVVKS